MRLARTLFALLISSFACGIVGCGALTDNPAATAACATEGPGSGPTNEACIACCRKNGGTGRKSDTTKCLCIGK